MWLWKVQTIRYEWNVFCAKGLHDMRHGLMVCEVLSSDWCKLLCIVCCLLLSEHNEIDPWGIHSTREGSGCFMWVCLNKPGVCFQARAALVGCCVCWFPWRHLSVECCHGGRRQSDGKRTAWVCGPLEIHTAAAHLAFSWSAAGRKETWCVITAHGASREVHEPYFNPLVGNMKTPRVKMLSSEQNE